MQSATLRFGPRDYAKGLGDHVVARDTGKIVCDVRLELSIDPKDGSILHREADVDIDLDSLKWLEEQILANRDA